MKINTYRKKWLTAATPVKFLLLLPICWIAWVIFSYSLSYFTPDFNAGFLSDKLDVFDGVFKYGLYAHCLSAPLLIFLCSLLIFFRIERRWPAVHRITGKAVIWISFLLFIPSSFILAQYAIGGWKGNIIFTCLTIAYSLSLFFGFYFIKKGNLPQHRRWMLRLYIFLLSGIQLRVIKLIFAYGFRYVGESSYLWASTLSWILPWIILELVYLFSDRYTRDKKR